MKQLIFLLLFTSAIFAQSELPLLLDDGNDFSPLSLNPFAYYLDGITKDANNKVAALESEVNTYTFLQGDTSKSPIAVDDVLTFSGNDNMTIADINSGDYDFGTNDFSISFWIKTSTLTADAIINKYPSTNPRWRVYINAGCIVFYFRTATGTAFLQTTATINDNQWHHVVCVLDRDIGVTIYIDKVAESEGGNEWTNLASDNMNNGGAVYLGSQESAVFLNGSISNIMVFKKTLRQADVDNLYKANSKFWGDVIGIPLNIPTYDGNPSVTHPDVIYTPDGWNGYKYWMAFTPYPASDRENPSIVVSNNGINWLEPEGITNPIVTLAEVNAQGWDYSSDTDIIFLSGNLDTLALYYRLVDTPEEVIYRKVSTDGINWSAFQPVLGVDTAGIYPARSFMSPAVVYDSSKYKMFTVRYINLDSAELNLRYSNDGLSFGLPIKTTLPDFFLSIQPVYHCDVIVDNAIYYLLLNTGVKLYLLTSEDGGYSWVGSESVIVPFTTGYEHYRSTFIKSNENPSKFNIWVSLRSELSPWIFYYYENLP